MATFNNILFLDTLMPPAVYNYIKSETSMEVLNFQIIIMYISK